MVSDIDNKSANDSLITHYLRSCQTALHKPRIVLAINTPTIRNNIARLKSISTLGYTNENKVPRTRDIKIPVSIKISEPFS